MKLENLSLNELWELFPVIFTDSTDAFGDVYAAEERILNALLDGYISSESVTSAVRRSKISKLNRLLMF